MTFLAPIPALLAAAVCVPALLALYLLRLRRRPVRVGSILHWPAATEDVQANVPLRWLRPSWLLLLHLLALACLLLAFARPAVRGAAIAGERVVIVLDVSASMSAVDAGRTTTRLDRAKITAKRLARDLKSARARSIAVVELAARARPLTGFTTSQSLIASAIDSAEATDQPGNLGAALQLVDALGRGEAEENGAGGTPTVFLVSDGSFDLLDELPAATTPVRFERIGADAVTDNIGVLRLGARRDERDAALLRVFAELVSTSAAPVDVPVTLALDGVSLESRVVSVPAHATALFEVRGLTQGVLTLAIARPDALASDDASSVVLPPPQQPRILLVQGGGTASAEQRRAPTWLLGDILEELMPRELARATPDEYERLVRENGDRSFDLVVADTAFLVTPPRVPSLCLGVAPALGGLGIAGGVFPVPADSIYWDRTHPLMQGVSLDGLVVREALDLPIIERENAQRAPDVVARADDRPLIMLVEEAGVLHVVVAFELASSNWPLTPSFAVFVANAVDELTLRARSSEGKSFTTDEVVTFTAPARGAVSLDGPVRVQVRDASESSAGEAQVSAGVLPRAGVYVVRLTGAEATPRTPRAVAVNVADEVESALASPTSVRVKGREIGSVQPTRVPREVWHWFVLAALALLGVEWIAYARQVRA
jgi:uncharacterized protein YegL